MNQPENTELERKKEQTQNTKQILEKQVLTKQVGDTIEVEVIYEVLENIATKEKLVF